MCCGCDWTGREPGIKGVCADLSRWGGGVACEKGGRERGYSAKSEREKVTFLLLWIGRHRIDLYNSWTWNSPEDKHKLDAVWKKFSDHIEPKVNAHLASFQLSQLKQHSDEAMDDFIARCRVAAAKCKFADIVEMNTRLIEQLTIGTQHDYVRGKLWKRETALPVWTKQWTSPELLRRRRLMSLSSRAMHRHFHRHRLPQFMDSAERRRTRNALVVDVGTPHKNFAQQRDPPVVAVGGKPLGHCVHCNGADS